MNTNPGRKIVDFSQVESSAEQPVCESCGAARESASFCRACAYRLVDIALSDSSESLFSSLAEPQAKDDATAVAIPLRYDHFEICVSASGVPEELGRGSMGITYRAIDRNLDTFVALKIINARHLGGVGARERFLREARTAARLRHPNIASVFHLGLGEENCFYAMEYIEGETLDARILRDGALPYPTALNILMQAVRGLQVAHAQGFIHRDLKPSNIMLVSGDEITVKVIDFGLVKAMADHGAFGDQNCRNYFAGTPHYASPEQLGTGEVDARSDIYSLGICFYYMLTGTLPRAAKPATNGQPREQSFALPTDESCKDVPSSVLALLRSMVAFDPASRPATAAALLKKASECTTTFQPQLRSEKFARKIARRKVLGIWLCGVVFCSIAILLLVRLNSLPMSQTATSLPPVRTSIDQEARSLYAQGDECLLRRTKADNQRAIDLYSKAIAHSTDFADAHAGLSIAIFQNVARYGAPASQLDLAINHAERAISLDPHAPRGYHALGIVRTLQGRHWEALAQLRKALEVDAEYLPAQREYGMLWCSLGQPQFGLPWAKKSTQIDPAHPAGWCVAADACVDLCWDDQAVEYYRRCLEIFPTWTSARCGLLHIHLLQGDFAQARQDFHKIESIEPGLTLPLNLKAQIELFSGHYDEAEPLYWQLLALNRSGLVNYYGGISYLSALGFLRQKAGDLEKSRQLLEEASTLHQESEGAHGIYDIAAIRAIQGSKEGALASLQQAVDSGWLDFRAMNLDPRFESLRHEPEFQTMIDLLRTRVEHMRAESVKLCAKPLLIADFPTNLPPK